MAVTRLCSPLLIVPLDRLAGLSTDASVSQKSRIPTANCSALNACTERSEVIEVSLIGLSQSPWLVRDLDDVSMAPAQVSRTTVGPFVAQPPRQ